MECFAVGIQWHPEMMADSEEQQKIFQVFISACKKGEKNEHDMYM